MILHKHLDYIYGNLIGNFEQETFLQYNRSPSVYICVESVALP